ncbi:MAG: hypothetical protein JNK76_06295 [Planctomycetales bacterium]|nr:hypothetical protein [Planctomycetales bacterium]
MNLRGIGTSAYVCFIVVLHADLAVAAASTEEALSRALAISKTESVASRFSSLSIDWTRITAAEDDDAPPDITEPGPDMGNFPNSAFTLRKGRSYVESAPLTMTTGNSAGPAAYLWPYLLRYGITDDVELRLLGNGLTSTFGQSPTTGFSPLCVDLKVHLWDGDDRLIPSTSLEVWVLTEWGSQAFNGGTQPSINLNFDLPLRESTNLELSVGLTGVQDAIDVRTGSRVKPRHRHLLDLVHQPGANLYQFACQWAVEQEVTDRLQFFVHGYYNGALKFDQGAGSVAGVGGFYQLSPRLTTFCSFNAGLDDQVAPFSTQWGWAYAL